MHALAKDKTKTAGVYCIFHGKTLIFLLIQLECKAKQNIDHHDSRAIMSP